MSEQKKKKEEKQKAMGVLVTIGAISVVVFIIVLAISSILEDQKGKKTGGADVKRPDITEMYLSPNPYSRSQKPLKRIKGVVVHYTANPGSSAKENRNYFENLKNKKSRYASSHYIVGLEGEIIQCVPLNEIAYASNERNDDTVSIECCHLDSTGKFNKKTYDSLVKLVAWISDEYGLEEEDIIRHYDVTGKMCPKYFVEHKNAWIKFKRNVFDYIEEQRVRITAPKKK